MTTGDEGGKIEARANDKHYPAGSGKGGQFAPAVSAYGANTFVARYFRSKAVANNHLEKHKKMLNEIGITTMDEYLDAALNLIESECDGENIFGFIYPDGRLVRYNAETKLFVVGRPSKGIYSCFVVDRENYFDEQFAKRDTSQEE